MSNNLLVEHAKSKSPVTNFFYDLLNTKRPNWKKASDKERLLYLVKYYSGLCFFNLGNSYHSFISWITQYYPFSLLYKDRLFHHDNLKARSFMIKIENLAKKSGINILVLSGGNQDEMTELIGYLDRKTKNRLNDIKTLEAVLQNKYETVYVRDDGDKVRILIPTATFEEIIKHG